MSPKSVSIVSALGIVAGFLLFYFVPVLVAHADPVAASAPSEPGWYVWLGIGLAALAGIETALKGLRMAVHTIAPHTRTTVDDRVDEVLGKVDDAMSEFMLTVRSIVPITKPETPSAKGGGTAAMLAVLLLGGLAAGTATGCTMAQAREVAAAGVVTALNCEDGHIDAVALADARAFAAATVQHWIAGSTAPNPAAIKADLGKVKSDLGRCAISGAVAAVLAVTRPTPGTAVSALSAAGPDPVALRGAFAVAARELGWAPVRVSGQVL